MISLLTLPSRDEVSADGFALRHATYHLTFSQALSFLAARSGPTPTCDVQGGVVTTAHHDE